MIIKTLAITGLLGLAPLAALAGDDSRRAAAAPSNGYKSISEIEQQLTAEGFKITDLERERRSFEVTGWEEGGRCVELRMDAKSGRVLHRERDDDCEWDDDGRYDDDDRYDNDDDRRRYRS